jgi:PP-loop superfamily ATP-utilizing enzyme
VDGANKDDEGDYRPGRKAARELGVVSVLSEVGMTKAEVRETGSIIQNRWKPRRNSMRNTCSVYMKRWRTQAR